MDHTRLEHQLRWAVEIDQMKGILRQTLIMDGSRRENDAEHSWHVALMAMVLGEHAATPDVDIARVVGMLLVHDLVEIDAGDTFCYDADAVAGQRDREHAAADRVFGLLPPDQAQSVRALWEEFDGGKTAEARFAHALDRVQPLLNNFYTGGGSWRRHQVRVSQVLERIAPVRDGAPALHAYACGLIERAAEAGMLIRD